MALRRSAPALVLAAAVAAAGLAGCASGPSARQGAADRTRAGARSKPGTQSGPSATRRPSTDALAEGPRSKAAASDWESFRATRAALAREIGDRAAALRSGPVGNRAVELAALRLADSAYEALDHGSLDAALGVAQKAVSLWGSNGYAYEVLAYVHLVQGRREDAAEFAALAARHLPRADAVRAELEGLRRSVEQGAPAA